MGKYLDWKEDAEASVRAFYAAVGQGTVAKILSGTVHQVEQIDHKILVMMDVTAGIDYIRENKQGLQGVAWRAQWNDGKPGYPYNTWSIRWERCTGGETEGPKRIRQIKNGYLYPYLTMQGYFSTREENQCTSIGICRTQDLYQYIKTGGGHQNRSDNLFTWVSWLELKTFGYPVSFWPKGTNNITQKKDLPDFAAFLNL